jgi:hypothetical protein
MSNLAAITKKQLPQLCLPREHGIVVILLIASLYSLVLQIKSVLFCTALLTLWLLVLSLQHPRQLMAIASISALSHACFNPLMALWITIVGTGLILISKTKIKQTWWHEFIGLGGATIAPLLTAFMVSNQLRLPLTIGTALLAGVYTSAAIIHGATLASGKGPPRKGPNTAQPDTRSTVLARLYPARPFSLQSITSTLCGSDSVACKSKSNRL